jgi:hypothetical protein
MQLPSNIHILSLSTSCHYHQISVYTNLSRHPSFENDSIQFSFVPSQRVLKYVFSVACSLFRPHCLGCLFVSPHFKGPGRRLGNSGTHVRWFELQAVTSARLKYVLTSILFHVPIEYYSKSWFLDPLLHSIVDVQQGFRQ